MIQEEDEGSDGDRGCSAGRPTGGGCKGAAAAAAQPQYFGVHQPSQGQGQGRKKNKKKNGQRWAGQQAAEGDFGVWSLLPLTLELQPVRTSKACAAFSSGSCICAALVLL